MTFYISTLIWSQGWGPYCSFGGTKDLGADGGASHHENMSIHIELIMNLRNRYTQQHIHCRLRHRDGTQGNCNRYIDR